MKRPDDMTLEELREELSDRLISPKVEELDYDELVAIKESMDIEDLKNDLLWEGLTSKTKLLESIKQTIAQYKAKENEMDKDKKLRTGIASSAVRVICKTLEQFKNKVKKMDLPELTAEFCGYTYEIALDGITLRQTQFQWNDAECSRGVETDLLHLPLLRSIITDEYGYEMEGEYMLYDS